MQPKAWTSKKLMEGAEPIFLQGTKDIGVLLYHGWSSSPQEFNPSFTESTAKYLHGLGYTVYIPLHRGHGTEPNDMLDVGWREWLADARLAYDFLARRAKRIIVGGMSMGANLALVLASEKSVAGVIPMGAPIFFRFHFPGLIWAWLFRNQRSLHSKRYRKRDAYITNRKVHYLQYPPKSAYEAIHSRLAVKKILDKVTAPILIMHSLGDNVAHPFSASYIKWRVGSKDKQVYLVQKSYHSFTTDTHSGEANRVMGDFISRVTGSQ
ncbi:MAG: alpha/beta fold hydrolase [Candidatus Colwellbacteria bacterium]|nr:alpha/beta fold hydrolase [Candidatus Colwellbacteria bacterium]